jgi:transposase-like protein
MSQASSGINGFTPAEALDIFDISDLDSVKVRGWVYAKLHPTGFPSCPACDEYIQSDRALATYRDGGRVCCHACKKFFTNRTDTILHGSQLTFEQVYLIAVLSAFADRTSADRSAAHREIARIVGLHPDSIKNWEKIFAALETPLV